MEAVRFEDFVGIVNALHKEIERIKTAEAARLGLKGADVMCLYYLVKGPDGMTGSELARACDVSRAAVSRTLSHLASEGIVEVDAGSEGSRYRALVRLTEHGRQVTVPLLGIIREVVGEAGHAFDGCDRERVYDVLNETLGRLRCLSRT